MTLRRVTRGERLRIPAESWNALMDVAEAHRADRFSLGMERQAARQRAGIIRAW